MRWAGYYPCIGIAKCAVTGTVPTHPSGPVGHPGALPSRDLAGVTLAACPQRHGIQSVSWNSVQFHGIQSVSWNSVHFMEFSIFYEKDTAL